jgi:hypothetical protein
LQEPSSTTISSAADEIRRVVFMVCVFLQSKNASLFCFVCSVFRYFIVRRNTKTIYVFFRLPAPKISPALSSRYFT